MTFRMIQPNPYFLLCIGTILRKLHAKKEKKLSDSFLRNQAFNWKVDDGRTTDELALEKLRCLSAGGAKKLSASFWEIKLLNEKLTTDDDERIGIRKAPLPFGWRS